MAMADESNSRDLIIGVVGLVAIGLILYFAWPYVLMVLAIVFFIVLIWGLLFGDSIIVK